MTTRLVLACSGAPGSIAAIPSLARDHGADVVTVTLDLGQGGDLDDVRQRALAAGAVRAHVLDVREEFAREYVLRALQAGALEGTGGPAAAALNRPLVARKLVEIARIEGAAAVAHGCTLEAGDQTRIENAIRALDTSLRVVAVPASGPASATMSGTRPPGAAPDAPASVELAFERGVPVAINGVEMTLTELIDSVTTIAAGHGVGDAVLQAAHDALEASVTPSDRRRAKLANAARYAAIIEQGAWFSPEREALDALCAALQDDVTGTVHVELFKGQCAILGRRPPVAPEPARA